MKALLAPIAAGLALTLTACGGADPEATVLPGSSAPARTTPPPAAAAGTLSRIADVDAAHTRIGYVNTPKLAAFDGPLGADAIQRLVLGAGAPRVASETTDPPATAVQIGDATVLDGATRTVLGGSPTLRAALTPTNPSATLITDETPSAVQSCLADGPAEVIVGSAALGRSAAMGAALLDSADPPAGRKLLICVAPHFVRQLEPTLARLRRQFDNASLPAAQRPKIGEADIGERDIVTAAISLATIPTADLRELLRGGDALTRLAGD